MDPKHATVIHDGWLQENVDVHTTLAGAPWRFTPAELQSLAVLAVPCRGDSALGLQKCWADPATLMCMHKNGSMFHCP
jgi:hypothetical protein